MPLTWWKKIEILTIDAKPRTITLTKQKQNKNCADKDKIILNIVLYKILANQWSGFELILPVLYRQTDFKRTVK